MIQQFLPAAFALVAFLGTLVVIATLAVSGQRVPDELWTILQISLGGVLGSGTTAAVGVRRGR